MTSAKSIKKRVGKKQVAIITANKPKPAVKPKVLAKKELNSFLALHVGELADAYLHRLAMNQKECKHSLY